MKKLLAAVIAAWACSVAAQDVTGNLIYTTPGNPPPQGSVYSWSGFILTDSGGGGLSGGNVPAYNPYVGQFMWGYTPGTIDYSMSIGSALSGTGLQIIGLQYGLEYFNQDFSRGSLSATWNLRDGTNKVLESYYHTFGYTTEGWTKFDMTKTFASPYSLASVATLGFTATGTDDRFWAGYYGPQIRDPYARLMYGVDPCATNVLSSPTCPGFAEAMARLSPPVPALQPVAATPMVTVEPVVTAQPAVVEITPTTTVATAAPTVTAVASAVPSAVPATTPTATASTASRSSTSASNSAAVAVAMRAVAETQATVNTVLAQAQESAVASQAADTSSNNTDPAASGSAAGNSALGSGLTISFGFQMPGTFALPGTTMALGQSSVNTSQTATSTASTTTDMSAGSTQNNTIAADAGSNETSPTSTRALAAMSSPQIITQEDSTSAPGASTVRNVAPPSELAGGPDIGAMAVAPQGFNAYLTAQLRDAAFYPPREVYRGQRNVDNARALRGLGSDARHQEMVDQQYRK